MSRARIIGLRATGFMRLEAVELVLPENGAFRISGPNGQGKTSLVNVIVSGIGGPRATAAKPVREGHNSARLELDLRVDEETQRELEITTGNLKLIRRFDKDGKHSVEIRPETGPPLKTPQSVLSALQANHIGFDPMEFYRMKAGDKATTLREIAGYDCSDLTKERAEVFAKRTDANRAVGELQAAYDQLPWHDDAPGEPVSIVAVAGEYKAANETIKANAAKRTAVATARNNLDAATLDVERLENELRAAQAKAEACVDALVDAERAATNLVEPDLKRIEVRMESVENLNGLLGANKAKLKKEQELRAAEALAAKLDGRIKEIDEAGKKRLAAARFPVHGLSMKGDVITFNGIPIDQASTAEQILIAVAISAALNPGLRIVLIYDGSLLDRNTFAAINKYAIENDMLVIAECVATEPADVGSGPGVLILDGEIAEVIS